MAPFEYSDYRDANTGSLLELLQQRGAIAADAATRIGAVRAAATQQSGAAKAGAIQQALAIPGQIVDDTRQRAERARNQMVLVAGEVGRLAQQANGDPVAFKNGVSELARMGVVPKETADHIFQRIDAGGPDALKSYAVFGPQVKAAATRAVDTVENGQNVTKIVPDVPGASYPAPVAPTPKTPTRVVRTMENGKEVDKIVPDEPGASYEVPAATPPKPTMYKVTVPGPGGKPVEKLVTEDELKAGVQGYEKPPAPEKPVDQNKLEQDYRTVLTRAMSNRSGGIGAEDTKVRAANHLLALMDQYLDPKSGEYTVPPAQYSELALGLANLVSPGGTAGIELEREIKQASLKGDIAKMVTYATGTPVTGSTQDIFKNLRDSIQRQGSVAERQRENSLDYLRGLVPTDLEEERRTRLESAQMTPLWQSKILTNAKGERKVVTSTDGGKTWK